CVPFAIASFCTSLIFTTPPGASGIGVSSPGVSSPPPRQATRESAKPVQRASLVRRMRYSKEGRKVGRRDQSRRWLRRRRWLAVEGFARGERGCIAKKKARLCGGHHSGFV